MEKNTKEEYFYVVGYALQKTKNGNKSVEFKIGCITSDHFISMNEAVKDMQDLATETWPDCITDIAIISLTRWPKEEFYALFPDLIPNTEEA